MKQKKYTTKEGKEGIEYTPEDKDEVEANANKVFVGQPRDIIVKKGTPKERKVSIVRYGISALWNGKEIFCKLTKGQMKYLESAGNLMGKTLMFKTYKNKDFGLLLGVEIKEEKKKE